MHSVQRWVANTRIPYIHLQVSLLQVPLNCAASRLIIPPAQDGMCSPQLRCSQQLTASLPFPHANRAVQVNPSSLSSSSSSSLQLQSSLSSQWWSYAITLELIGTSKCFVVATSPKRQLIYGYKYMYVWLKTTYFKSISNCMLYWHKDMMSTCIFGYEHIPHHMI